MQLMLHKGFSSLSLLVAIAAAFILGISVYIVSHGSRYNALPGLRSTARGAQANATPDTSLTSGEITSTMPDIINHDENLVCTFKIPPSGPANPFTNGTLWTSGGKGRSTISTNGSRIAIEANAIYQNDIAYVWITTGGQTAGLRFNPDEINDTDTSFSPQERQQADQIRASMIFDCQPWTVDDTKFITPSDVEFQEK